MPTEFGKAEIPGDLTRGMEWMWEARAERYLEALIAENIS